jgi:hypothetical protein
MIEGQIKPRYRRASFSGESVVLENKHIKLILFKRLCGWGFGEVYDHNGKLMAVIDHFGELLLRDQEIPMRLEAKDYVLTEKGGVKTVEFEVETTVPSQKLKGTSFEKWVHFPFAEPVLKGKVAFSLGENDTFASYRVSLVSTSNVYARYLRLLWLLCGESSYGAEKEDALLPGVDWPRGREWSGGDDFFKDPWAARAVPHPNKIGAPFMAVSHGGSAVSVSFDLNTPVTRWFNYNEIYPQPVFACPNYIQRSDNNLLGIMLPDVKTEAQENKPFADEPLEIHIGQRFEFKAEIETVKGDSLDALVAFVKRRGMPDPEPRFSLREALDFFADAYNTNLWHEGEGFGYRQQHLEGDSRGEINFGVPSFIRRYIAENPGSETAEGLKAKLATFEKTSDKTVAESDIEVAKERARASGDRILKRQREDGSFCFEPDGAHYSKDDFRVAREFIEPMGHDGDSPLYMNTEPALALIDCYKASGDKKYLDAALRALDFCINEQRPEAGDYWETPLRAPNLLASGQAVCAYYEAYRITDKEVYREKAVRFLRALLAFTHLRNGIGVKSLYNTKPCLCSSDWYFANWVRDFVQWEVIHCYDMAISRGIRWEEIDRELDWAKFAEGVVTASFNMFNKTGEKPTWRPHNIPATYDLYLEGAYNGCMADTYNSVTGNIGGMFIRPDAVATAVYDILDRKGKEEN